MRCNRIVVVPFAYYVTPLQVKREGRGHVGPRVEIGFSKSYASRIGFEGVEKCSGDAAPPTGWPDVEPFHFAGRSKGAGGLRFERPKGDNSRRQRAVVSEEDGARSVEVNRYGLRIVAQFSRQRDRVEVFVEEVGDHSVVGMARRANETVYTLV